MPVFRAVASWYRALAFAYAPVVTPRRAAGAGSAGSGVRVP